MDIDDEKLKKIMETYEKRREIRRDVILHMYHGGGIPLRKTPKERERIMREVDRKVDKRIEFEKQVEKLMKERYDDKGLTVSVTVSAERRWNNSAWQSTNSTARLGM